MRLAPIVPLERDMDDYARFALDRNDTRRDR
jgi:hypothetical protein